RHQAAIIGPSRRRPLIRFDPPAERRPLRDDIHGDTRDKDVFLRRLWARSTQLADAERHVLRYTVLDQRALRVRPRVKLPATVPDKRFPAHSEAASMDNSEKKNWFQTLPGVLTGEALYRWQGDK